MESSFLDDIKDEGFFYALAERPFKTALAGLIACTLLWTGWKTIANNIEYSKGARVGMINKFSEKGLIWKKYDGQLALEGIVSNSNAVGANVWDFSLDNFQAHGESKEELVKKITGYMDKGEKVKITYTQPVAVWPWRASETYLVQNVEPIGRGESGGKK
jgi:hypothetical protein